VEVNEVVFKNSLREKMTVGSGESELVCYFPKRTRQVLLGGRYAQLEIHSANRDISLIDF